MDRNSAIFWVLYMSGTLFGNLYVFFAWRGKTEVSQGEQTTLSIILSVLVLIGTILVLFIKKVPDPGAKAEEIDDGMLKSAWKYTKSSFQMAKHKEVQLMLPVMIFSGFELGFWETIYPTIIGTQV